MPSSHWAARDHGVPPAFWDAVSARYDRQLWLERAAVRTAVTMLGAGRDDDVLDLGTGTGEAIRQLAATAVVPRAVIGVDRSAAMLARVGRLPPGWSLTVADARSLPFGEDRFDAASVCHLLHVVADRDRHAILAELFRVLRPGGRVVVVTPALAPAGLARLLARALDAIGARWPERLGGLRALDPRPLLERAGFELLEVRFSARGYVSICVLARRPTSRSAGGAASSPDLPGHDRAVGG